MASSRFGFKSRGETTDIGSISVHLFFLAANVLVTLEMTTLSPPGEWEEF
jgi:hypothetical protein